MPGADPASTPSHGNETWLARSPPAARSLWVSYQSSATACPPAAWRRTVETTVEAIPALEECPPEKVHRPPVPFS